MILQIFSVFDSKVEDFMTPFFSQTIKSGQRAIANLARETDHPLNTNGEDYTLFHIGQFDTESALITTQKTPVALGLAITLGSPPRLPITSDHAKEAQG